MGGWGGERMSISLEMYFTTHVLQLHLDQPEKTGTEEKPADILLPGWSGGKDTALDITVVNPLQTAYINQSAAVPGHALRKAYEKKMAVWKLMQGGRNGTPALANGHSWGVV